MIMSKCTTTIPDIEFQNMKEALPALSVYYSQHGRLTEEIMDQHNIMSISNQASRQKPKDQRVLHQEIAILLTATYSFVKYNINRLERIMAPIVAAERIELRNIAHVVKKMAAEARRKAIEDRKATKTAEKRRWKSLSKDEQKSERADKRRKNKELGDVTALIIEGYDGVKLNPNKFIIQDLNSSDTTLDIFDDSSNFI